MKKVLISALILATASEASALELTARTKGYLMTFGCAIGGGLVGSALNSQNSNPNKNPSSTIYASSMAAGALCMGADAAFDFFDDDQTELVKKNNQAQKIIERMEKAMVDKSYGNDGGPKSLVNSMELRKHMVGDGAYRKMLSKDCKAYNLKLGGDSVKAPMYIPVNENVFIKNIEFGVAAAKVKGKQDGPCVNELGLFPYLDKELPGLGNSLLQRGKKLLKEQMKKKRSKKNSSAI